MSEGRALEDTERPSEDRVRGAQGHLRCSSGGGRLAGASTGLGPETRGDKETAACSPRLGRISGDGDPATGRVWSPLVRMSGLKW